MYETLAVWEADSTLAGQADLAADAASTWKAADKIVCSSTPRRRPLRTLGSNATFDPSAVLTLKVAARRDLLVGGPHLAAKAPRRRGCSTRSPCSSGLAALVDAPSAADPHKRRARAHRRAPIQQRRRPPPLPPSVTTQESPPSKPSPTAGSEASTRHGYRSCACCSEHAISGDRWCVPDVGSSRIWHAGRTERRQRTTLGRWLGRLSNGISVQSTHVVLVGVSPARSVRCCRGGR